MAHEVFISHAHKDKQIAHLICEKLESARVKCWIAERDISPGEDWTEATRNAIGCSHVMVLLLSENANAAAHMEREMAHAFYTRRPIIPLRLSDTLPRRDFLFYLGNARSFDAFGPTAEQRLEAFTTAVHDRVRVRSEARVAMSFHGAKGTAAGANFSESWIGALQASHYQTLEIVKRAAIAASLFGAGWLFWFAHQQNEREMTLGESNSRPSQSGARPAMNLSPRDPADTSALKSTYAYTRFGLWVAPNTGATSAAQRGTQNPLSLSQEQVDPKTTGEGESLNKPVQNMNSAPEGSPPTGIRREEHRGKSRPKSHQKRVSGSARWRIAQIKNRLLTAWQQFVARGKEIRNR
jgi:TIR domain